MYVKCFYDTDRLVWFTVFHYDNNRINIEQMSLIAGRIVNQFGNYLYHHGNFIFTAQNQEQITLFHIE